MKTIICCLLSIIIASYTTWMLNRTKLADISSFNDEQVVNDMRDRCVIIPPGQPWFFTADQKLLVKVLQKKPTEEGVHVSAYITTESNKVSLNGVLKINYELIAGEWYLAEIASIDLKALQK